MTFFRSYFDESGKFKDQKVISFCGLVASPASRDAFSASWDGLLRGNMLSCLHTKELLKASRSVGPVIRSHTPAERCEALKPFIDCIFDHLDLGIIVAVDTKTFSKWDPDALKRVGGSDDPAYFAFLQATMGLKIHACREDDRISIMCDDDEGTAWNFYQLYRQMKKKDPELHKKFVSLSFANDELFPVLQAADLVAALIRLECKKVFGYHPHDFGSLVSYLLAKKPNRKFRWLGMIGDDIKLGEIGNRLRTLKD